MSRSFSSRRARAAAPLWCALLATTSSSALAADTITVTGTRTPVRASDVVADITLIDREALQRAEGRTLVDLLTQQAGLQMSSNGGPGKTASVFIRGLEARHTLLLVDGVPLSAATVGSPSLDNLPLELVDRIEIVRGPMTALYGNGAMGGVIQIFTRQAVQGLGAQAKVAAGSNHHGQAAAGVSFGSGGFDAVASLQRSTTRGQSSTNPLVPFGSYNADDDGFRQTSGSVKLGWQPAAGWRLEWLSLASRGNTQLDDGPGVDARAELRNEVHLLSLRAQPMPGWTSRLAYSQSVDAYDTLASASPFASLGTIQTRQHQLSWENQLATPLGTALALAERSTQTVSRPGTPFAVSERDIDALALGLNGQGAGHTWQASLRRDRNDQFGGVTTGAAGWGYSLTPAWRVLASVGASHTLPSFNQLYFPGFGNDKLLPEEGRQTEAHLRWTEGAHTLRATAYDYRIRGYISGGPQPVNLPRTRIQGITLAWEAQFDALKTALTVDHVDPRNATAGTANFDKLLPRRARNALKAQADWTLGAWTVGGAFNAFSHRFDNPANTLRLGGYATLDVHADWALRRHWTLGLRLNNLADRAYETAWGYNQPGRAGFVTLRWQPA